MENRNIYKTDDFLIIISYITIIPLAVLAWPWLRTFGDFENLKDFFLTVPAVLGPRLTALILYGCAGVSSQIIGRIIRHGERQSLEILDTLQFYKKTTIPQLASQLDMSESKITNLVRKMARVSSLGISIEGEAVSIGHKEEPLSGYGDTSSYSTVEPQFTEEKADTDEKIEKEFKGFDSEFKEALKKAASKENLSEAERKEELKKVVKTMTGMKSGQPGAKKFNFILFIILFLTPLWPLALIYAISFAVKQKNAALSDRSNEMK